MIRQYCIVVAVTVPYLYRVSGVPRMGPTNVAHRAGGWKQSNKNHNTGGHRSKGAVEKENRGRVSKAPSGKRKKKMLGKAGRRHQHEQLRRAAKEEVAARKRAVGGQGAPPVLVGVLALAASQEAAAATLVTSLTSCMPGNPTSLAMY